MPVRERGEARDGGEHHAPQDRALAGRRAPAQQGWLDCLNGCTMRHISCYNIDQVFTKQQNELGRDSQEKKTC